MKITILLGAPGSGKGTIAEKVRDACGVIHLSTGDALRAAVKEGTEVGKKAEEYMTKGELVPDDVIVKIVEDRFDAGSGDENFLFDGFPRTENQAELLEKGLAARDSSIAMVILLDAPRDVLMERLTGRRICRQCGQSFHIKNIPPKVEGVCDKCGGELYQRKDDQEETIANRLEVYKEQTEGLIARYEGQGLLKKIDSTGDADEVGAEIADLIKGA